MRAIGKLPKGVLILEFIGMMLLRWRCCR
ncbi:DUF1418 family protein [Escherichia coli]